MTPFIPDPAAQPEFCADVPGKRFMAWVLDTIIIVSMTLVACLLTLGIGFFVFLGVMTLVGLAYRIVTIANGSATWGMRIAAVEMRDSQGQPMNLMLATLHTLGYYVSFSAFPLQLVSIVLMLTTERKQGLTDMVLGTQVINKMAHPV
jgi:uncharacterized RDD family membrane protein YckC